MYCNTIQTLKIMIFKVILRPAAAHRPLACTFAGRAVFFPMHMSSEKTYRTFFAFWESEFCEAFYSF